MRDFKEGEEAFVRVPNTFPSPFSAYNKAWLERIRLTDGCSVTLSNPYRWRGHPGWYIKVKTGHYTPTNWFPTVWLYRNDPLQGRLFL